MPIRPVVQYKENAEILRKKSNLVTDASHDEIVQLIVDLKDTLNNCRNGVGLAAPQIGVHQRVIAVCFGAGSEEPPKPPMGIINPEIIEAGQEQLDFDGCLSFPGLYAKTVRPHYMRLKGLDEKGRPFEMTLDGFDAVVVHHEIDHLNGVVFVDRVASPDEFFTEDAPL